MLAEPARKIKSYEISATNWNKKNKEYQLKLRTGDLRKIFEIYQSLSIWHSEKELSFGEKNLLNQTESLIAEEISIVKKLDPQKAIEHLRSVFGYIKKSVHSPDTTQYKHYLEKRLAAGNNCFRAHLL